MSALAGHPASGARDEEDPAEQDHAMNWLQQVADLYEQVDAHVNAAFKYIAAGIRDTHSDWPQSDRSPARPGNGFGPSNARLTTRRTALVHHVFLM
jgi:hypothetical protein